MPLLIDSCLATPSDEFINKVKRRLLNAFACHHETQPILPSGDDRHSSFQVL